MAVIEVVELIGVVAMETCAAIKLEILIVALSVECIIEILNPTVAFFVTISLFMADDIMDIRGFSPYPIYGGLHFDLHFSFM